VRDGGNLMRLSGIICCRQEDGGAEISLSTPCTTTRRKHLDATGTAGRMAGGVFRGCCIGGDEISLSVPFTTTVL